MKIFIAGASGVLGRRLIQQFSERGHTVLGLARDDNAARTIERLGAAVVRGSIFNAEEMAGGIRQADVVIHAATSIPVKPIVKEKDWEMNDRLRREGTRALTEMAAKVGAKTYIQQSIVWVARPPDDSFFDENTKLSKPDGFFTSAFDGENIALEAGRRFGFNVSVLRGGGFYSSDAAHTRMMADGLSARRLPIIGSGAAVQASIHADDAASAYVAAAEAGKNGVWHITDNQPLTMKELLLELAIKLKAPAPRHLPVWLARLFLWRGMVEFFTRSTRTSNALFRREFGWSPRFPSFREGLTGITRTWRGEGLYN